MNCNEFRFYGNSEANRQKRAKYLCSKNVTYIECAFFSLAIQNAIKN